MRLRDDQRDELIDSEGALVEDGAHARAAA
jgi:hypothetical protein